MAPKTQEQFTAICDGLFLNDSKPKEWKQDFPWEASVGFHFRPLDESGEPVGEIQRKYLKKIWLFQAMGGKNAQGHYFRLEAEHGEIPAKDGKPPKPYTTIYPIAEVFSDGQARFLEEPKNGKIGVPGPGDKPKGPVTPPGPKTSSTGAGVAATPTTPAATGGIVTKATTPAKDPPPPKPRPKPSESFMNLCFEPQTEKFWLMQEGFTEDGFVQTAAHQHAMSMTLNRMGWANQKGLAITADMDAGAREFSPICDEKYKAEFMKWADWFEWYISTKRWAKIRERFYCLLKNCLTREQVLSLVDRAWAKLPKSQYNLVAEQVRIRLEEILANTPMKNLPTATPEIFEPKLEAAEEAAALKEMAEAEAATTETEEPQLKLLDPKIVDWTVAAYGKTMTMKALLDFWISSTPELQANERVRAAFRLAIMDQYMRSNYQSDVDEFRKGIPSYILTPEFAAQLDARYEQMEKF